MSRHKTSRPSHLKEILHREEANRNNKHLQELHHLLSLISFLQSQKNLQGSQFHMLLFFNANLAKNETSKR